MRASQSHSASWPCDEAALPLSWSVAFIHFFHPAPVCCLLFGAITFCPFAVSTALFVQTCEVGTRCPFTQGLHTLDLDLAMCEEAFGIRPEEVREQVRLTNLFYGGDRPRYSSRYVTVEGIIPPYLRTASPLWQR